MSKAAQRTDAASVLASLRKGNANAVYRIKNAMRVNPTTYWCSPSPITVQAREIAQARKSA